MTALHGFHEIGLVCELSVISMPHLFEAKVIKKQSKSHLHVHTEVLILKFNYSVHLSDLPLSPSQSQT